MAEGGRGGGGRGKGGGGFFSPGGGGGGALFGFVRKGGGLTKDLDLGWGRGEKKCKRGRGRVEGSFNSGIKSR